MDATKLGKQSFVLASKTQCLGLILNMFRLEERNTFIMHLPSKGCCGFFRNSFKKQKPESFPYLLNCNKLS